MARYVYNAALVQNTIDTLHAAVDLLETTDEAVEKGIEMIMYANGAEVMDIDFSQITNYHIQVVEYIDAMTNELRRKAQEIEEYQNAPWYKKVFSTIGLSALKLIEGLGTFVENIGDGVVAITGFVGGIFSSDFKDACGEAIKKDIVGDAFANAYTEGWLKNVNKYSAMSHESTGANVFKGFGVAAGYVAISLVTGGSSLAVEIGVEAGLAGITGIGAGTQEGLQAGKSYNQAFAQGVKTGAVAAAGEAVMGYGINKLMKVKEVQDAIGTAITSVKKAKTKVTSIFRKNTDTIATALKNSDETLSVAKNAGNSLLSSSASKTFKMSDEIAAIAGKTDDVADTVYDARKALVAADDAVDTVKKFDSVATKADEVVSSTTKASETIIKTSDDVASIVATKADDAVASAAKASDDVAIVVATKADDAARLASPGKQQPLALPAGAADEVVKVGDDVAEVVKTPTKPNINDYGNVGMYGTKADDAVSYQKSLHNARNGSAGSGEWQESVAKLADTYGTGKGGQNLNVNGLNEFNAAEKSAAFYGKQLVEGNAKNANAYIENLAQISGYGDDFNDFIADEALRYATDKAASEMAGSALGALGKSGTSLGIAGLSLIDDIPLPGNVIKNIAQAGVGSSDNIIRAGINSVDDVMKMGDDIAAVTNKTAKNIDEIPRGRNADGTYRLTKDEIIQDDLAKAKPKDTTYRLTRDQIIQDDISAVEEVVTKAADAVDVIEEVAAHTDEAAKGAKTIVRRTDDVAENAKSVVAKTDEAADVVEEVVTHTDEVADAAKAVAKTDEVVDVVEEVATHTDEVADAAKAVAKTDEVVDVVEEVVTHTDEVADAAKAVAKTDEVVDVVEEVATHTDEVADAAKAVARNTDEVVDVVEEVATHTDKVADAAKAVARNSDEVVDVVEEVATHTDEVVGTAKSVVAKTDEMADVIEEVATHTDEVVGSAKLVVAKTDEMADVIEEVATHTDEVVGSAKSVVAKTDEMADVIEEVATHTDEAIQSFEEIVDESSHVVKVSNNVAANLDEITDAAKAVIPHVDEAAHVVSNVAVHSDEVVDVIEEIATHTDEAVDVSKAVVRNTDEVVDAVEEVATHTDESAKVIENSLEGKTNAKRTSFESGVEEITGNKTPDLKIADDVEVVNISSSLDNTPSHFDEILANAESKAAKVFDDATSPIRYGDEAAESLFGKDAGKRFEDLSRRHSSKSRIDQLMEYQNYYRDEMSALGKRFHNMIDGNLTYESMDSYIRRMRNQAEDFFAQYKGACRKALDSGTENFGTRFGRFDATADEILDFKPSKLFDEYELDQQYKMARRRLEYETEEMIAESMRYGNRGDLSSSLRHIDMKRELLDSNYRSVKKFINEFSEMEQDMSRTLRSTVDEIRTIDTGLEKTYKAAKYDQLSSIKSTPVKTYTSLEDYVKSMNLDGIKNQTGSGIIRIGDVEIKTNPEMLRNINRKLGTEGLERIKSGVITANDVQDIQDAIVSSIRKSASELDVSLPETPKYIEKQATRFGRQKFGIDELNSVNKYLTDVSQQFDTVSDMTVNVPRVSSATRAFGDLEELFSVTKQSDDIAAVVGKTSKTMDDSLTSIINKTDEMADAAKVVAKNSDEVVDIVEEVATHTDEVADAAKVVARNSDEVVDVVEEVATHTDEVADAAKVVARNTDEVVDVVEEVATHTDEVADAAKVVARNTDEVVDVVEEVATHTDEVADAAKVVARNSDEVVDVVEEVATHTDEVADAAKVVARNSDEVVYVVEEVATHTDEVADVAKVVVRNTDEVVDVVEEVATHTDETVNITNSAKTIDNATTSSDEIFSSSRKITNEAYGTAEYVEEASIFGSKGGAKNFFRRANNIPNAVPNTPVMTELQQQWVDYINYNISIGNKVTVPFNSTSELSSVMLSKIDDLSQVDIQLLDGLGDGVGSLKAKYQHPKYVQRVTYSGHEMNAIINRLEELQSKIDMSLPPSQRARQIYDILGSEVPVMRDFKQIPNGHEISASLRGLTPVNSAGKEGLVCAGYSSVYKELCERADIPCTYVRGVGNMDPLRGGQPGGHAWNIVHTEIGDIPVDVTWNACENGTSKWFGASDDFATTHWSDPDEMYQNYTQTSGMTPRYAVGTSTDKMNDVLRTMEQTYGSRSEALTRLEYYVSTGDANYVVDINDARNMVLTSEPVEVQNYVYYARQNNNIQQIVDTMNYKYGDQTSAYIRLRNYVATGNITEVTRTNGARDLLATTDVNLIDQYLRGLGW